MRRADRSAANDGTSGAPPSKSPPKKELPPTTTDDSDDDQSIEMDRALLSPRSRTLLRDPDHDPGKQKYDWFRVYLLGQGLFLALFAFWVLDSLKDPILGALCGGNLERHQPPAKLFSVCITLILVFAMEYLSTEGEQARLERYRSDEEVMDAGGAWARMDMQTTLDHNHRGESSSGLPGDQVPTSIFATIGVPYCLVFGLLAYILQFNPAVALTDGTDEASRGHAWYVLGYFFFAAIESFGSIMVATFWSYVNSTLSLHDAERYYGPIIAVAQLGAIGGSTMVAAHLWSKITLVIIACLIILLHILVMNFYSKCFPPTNVANDKANTINNNNSMLEDMTIAEETDSSIFSGIILILKHNYVLMIFGVSCLYEVSLTCMNYQFTLIGWETFEESKTRDMSFQQFMGHYGQLVNLSSLFLSFFVFPLLMKRFGLRNTIRIFPSLLLVANFVTFGALPGNLVNLFISMSILKAMTYSIHDPAKEILYMPTSNAIKFKAKFWIDVVGARIAKAVGSTINAYAGSVARSIHVASTPSLLTAFGLWVVCYKIGAQFDHLVATETIVGKEGSTQPSEFSIVFDKEILDDYAQSGTSLLERAHNDTSEKDTSTAARVM